MNILFMGTSYFGCPSIRQLAEAGRHALSIVTQPDRPHGRGRKLKPSAVKVLASELGLPVFQPESVNTPESLAHFASLEPDLIVVAAFGQKLGKRLLALPRHGSYNLHASLLPEYRGAAPVNRCLADGRDRTGITLMRMAPSIDTGAMLLQRAIPVYPTAETAPEVEFRLADLAAAMIVEAVPRIVDGSLDAIPQDGAKATLAPKLTRADGIVDWYRSAHQIACQVHAMQPWPMAFTFFYPRARALGRRLILHRARSVIAQPIETGMPPGAVLSVSDGRMLVQTGSGTLAIQHLQPAGRRAMDVDAFVRGHDVRRGDLLGLADG